MASELPSYARLLFVRMAPSMHTTSTMKFQKVKYRNDGFDPSKVTDKLYFRNDTLKKFVPVDQELYDQIVAGTVQAKM